MTVFLQLTTAGSDSGPFNLYSDTNGYAEPPFDTNVFKSSLEAGYTTDAPDGTQTVKVVSTGACINSIYITLVLANCDLAGYVEEITTTTTTTFPGYYTYYFSVGRTSSFQACGETPPFDNTFYSDSITLDLGSVLYTNSTLVTPVSGGDQWFFLGSDFIAYQVDNSGTIIDFFTCV